MIKGLVSCVIPSYKRCDTVTRAIDSVLAQTYKDIEVCLVDDNVPGDAYSEKLQEALEKYKGDNRVRYIAQEKHINGAVARNVGIKAANGEFVAFLDDDDEWLPNKIELQVNILRNNPALGGVTALWTLYEKGNAVRKCHPYTSENLQFKIFLRDVAVLTSTVLMKKDVIERFGGFNESLIRHQDLQFLVDALSESNFEVLPEYLVKIHSDSDINRPNVKKIIDAKKAFFKSVEESFKRYNKSIQKRIKNAHNYEIALLAVREHEFGIAMKYILKSGLKPRSIMDLIKRFKER